MPICWTRTLAAQVAAQASGRSPTTGMLMPCLIDVTGNFDDAAVRQIGDVAVVDDVEMSAINPPGFERFDDVGAVFLTALAQADRWRYLLAAN